MFQEIVTERLLLRSICLSDAAELFSYRSDPDVKLFQSWEPANVEEVSEFIKLNCAKDFPCDGWYQVAIASRFDSAIVGDLGLNFLESECRTVEVGISISPSHQSKGYASEALRAILALLFIGMEKHRVFASIDPRNTRSVALMERLGMRKEGHFIKSLWFKGEWVDDVVFAILESEWPRSR